MVRSTRSVMNSRCKKCTVWKDLTSAENTITEAQMMERLESLPSQEAGRNHSSNRSESSSIPTPHTANRWLPRTK